MSGHSELQLISTIEQFYAQLAGRAYISKYVNLSAFAFLVYISILTLDDEIEYVWKSKWNFSKFIYISTKYLSFCDGSITLVYMFNTTLQPSVCDVLLGAIVYSMAIGVVISEIVLLIRTWVAWGLSRYIIWYLTLTAFAVTATAIFIIQGHSDGQSPWPEHIPSEIPQILNCVNTGTAGIEEQYLLFVCVIVFELNVLILTLWNMKVNSIWWRNRDKNPLIYVFHCDSLVYLSCLLGISVVNVILFILKERNVILYAHIIVEPQRIVHGIFSAQLILNARKYSQAFAVNTSSGWSWFHPAGSGAASLSLSFRAQGESGTGSGGCSLREPIESHDIPPTQKYRNITHNMQNNTRICRLDFVGSGVYCCGTRRAWSARNIDAHIL